MYIFITLVTIENWINIGNPPSEQDKLLVS